ncbi:MAG: NAD(P)-dependent oxidoreductase [Candidatus Rokubacteria bacterium]|nr:NAD(P)-dependent oxidoreductase [Candidatus Rokubacteria bacterium]
MNADSGKKLPVVGFIGLGNMGSPMAGHLVDAGYPLVVHDARRGVAEPLLARGATWAGSAAAVAREAHTVITIVPSSKEVEALVAEMLPALGPGHLLVEMTTSDPSVTRRLAKEVAARGAAMIDAPVSGGVAGARAKTLAIMVGGEAADVARARPMLAQMGKNVFHVGGVGTGHAMKLVNNATSAACLTATTEAVVVAMRAGIDPARAIEIITASSGRSDATERKWPKHILTGTWDSGFAVALMHKDLTSFLRLAAECGFEPQVTAAAAAWFRRAMQGPLAGGDHVEIAKLIGYTPKGEHR